MDEIISYKMCAVKVRNAKLRNYLKHFKTFSLCLNILTPESSKTITLINGLLFYFKFQKQKFMHLCDQLSARAFKL